MTTTGFSDEVRIADRVVGERHPVFVIAEAGVNHIGSPEIALEMVAAAREAGADAVKFQTFRAENVASARAPKAKYQLTTTDPSESQVAMLKGVQLPREAFRTLAEECQASGIVFLSSPYSHEDVDFLVELHVPALKLASALLVEHEFVSHAASKGLPILLSTGMASADEVRAATSVVAESGNNDLVLLQCHTEYPSSPRTANLRVMEWMRKELGVLVGYSDHTSSDASAVASVALGATVIEKHFTLDRNLPGPDQAASLDPDGFLRFVGAVRDAEDALGSEVKSPSAVERANRVTMRRSVVAAVPIPRGAVIRRDMLTIKRPGDGLPPNSMNELVGKKVRIDLAPDTQISLDDLE